MANYIDQNNNNAQKINIKVPTNNTDEHDIAVIGMAVKLPGIENLNDFWKLIINRKTTIGKFPYYRANQIKTYLNKLSEKYNDISFEKVLIYQNWTNLILNTLIFPKKMLI